MDTKPDRYPTTVAEHAEHAEQLGRELTVEEAQRWAILHRLDVIEAKPEQIEDDLTAQRMQRWLENSKRRNALLAERSAAGGK